MASPVSRKPRCPVSALSMLRSNWLSVERVCCERWMDSRAELERVYPTSLIPIRVKAARMASERLIAILETGICRNIMNSLEMNA